MPASVKSVLRYLTYRWDGYMANSLATVLAAFSAFHKHKGFVLPCADSIVAGLLEGAIRTFPSQWSRKSQSQRRYSRTCGFQKSEILLREPSGSGGTAGCSIWCPQCAQHSRAYANWKDVTFHTWVKAWKLSFTFRKTTREVWATLWNHGAQKMHGALWSS